MKIANKIKLLSSFCVASLLAACGDSTTVNTEVGSFMKGQASGVAYTTETHTGVTDENGAFMYEPGENVSFYVGATQLGITVPASAEVSAFDLVPGSSIPVTAKEVKGIQNIHYMEYGFDATLDGQMELANLLSFLYSMDSDKLASNGIQVDPATHLSFANNAVNFKQSIYDFEYSKSIRDSLYDAYNSGAMDSARLIRFWKAFDDYAMAEGLAPRVFAQATWEEDEDNDGTIDDFNIISFDSRKLFTGVVRPDGEFTRDFDDYGDSLGSSDTYMLDTWSGATTRDIHGNIVGEAQYHNGTLTYNSINVYDANGNFVSNSYDSNGDGADDGANTFTYDANGNRLTQAFDSGADGTIDTLYTYTYNANNQELSYSRDDGNDGTINYQRVQTYDANGYRTSNTYDTNGDGTINREYLYAYDANGNQLFYSYDSNADGVPNYTRTYTYDANDNRLSYHYDGNGDGTADRIYLYTYDANGNRTGHTYDSNGDGTPERIYTYTYDANGNQLSYVEDSNADMTPDYIELYTYDANGYEASYAEDEDADGTPEYIEYFTHDADGNQTLYQEDEGNDGMIDYERVQTYDADGNRLSRTYDQDGDGTIDEIDTYTYQLINFLGLFTYNGGGGGP